MTTLSITEVKLALGYSGEDIYILDHEGIYLILKSSLSKTGNKNKENSNYIEIDLNENQNNNNEGETSLINDTKKEEKNENVIFLKEEKEDDKKVVGFQSDSIITDPVIAKIMPQDYFKILAASCERQFVKSFSKDNTRRLVFTDAKGQKELFEFVLEIKDPEKLEAKLNAPPKPSPLREFLVALTHVANATTWATLLYLKGGTDMWNQIFTMGYLAGREVPKFVSRVYDKIASWRTQDEGTLEPFFLSLINVMPYVNGSSAAIFLELYGTLVRAEKEKHVKRRAFVKYVEFDILKSENPMLVGKKITFRILNSRNLNKLEQNTLFDEEGGDKQTLNKKNTVLTSQTKALKELEKFLNAASKTDHFGQNFHEFLDHIYQDHKEKRITVVKSDEGLAHFFKCVCPQTDKLYDINDYVLRVDISYNKKKPVKEDLKGEGLLDDN